MDELMADGGKAPDLLSLSRDTLADLPEAVIRPSYSLDQLTPGIVHIGLGNFHRAHQAWYLHRLMQQGKALDWAIIGAGVRPADAAQRERLLAQDCLTTLIELDPSGKAAEVTGAMIDFLPVESDNAALIAQMADPAIRIVSLTVTEGGYFLDAATGGFDAAHPDMQHDAAYPQTPRTAFGAMIAALRLRRDAGHGPFTGQSCDNLQGNGKILRQTVASLARLSDPEFADWIDAHCSFPDAMVDCIVPATGPSEIALVQTFGISDAAPVTHENFRQWVIEDDFCAGRPPWEDVGVTMTDKVDVFEAMKIRILNGGHQIIADPAEIIGVETIATAMAHPLIRGFLHKVVTEEIAPHVAPVPGMTPQNYLSLIDRRFSNPEIKDTTRRVAFDGSSRHPGFLIPSIRDGLAKGTPVTGLALASALWARYCQGTREDGTPIAPNDPNWDDLQATARRARTEPNAWLEMRHIYGDLAQRHEFAASFSTWLDMIYDHGVEQTLRTYLEQ
ncbi:mannitol dehydrogenase family protein [Sulfitobacter sp. JBTF-M27]|uniref:Mannitol dehydrogenase family protein n=1 Tax=Sulfitobacter sediminilitoris TaxID=2698830 RepID=A0A6P0CGI3_9RHOB|nr:mannitol dehydrogenase family protein [Sulfitobacter sediminilitoris]NEK24398.1 mannitol dehydrogenase family protein [Sulfitobacter sediminilitoris]